MACQTAERFVVTNDKGELFIQMGWPKHLGLSPVEQVAVSDMPNHFTVYGLRHDAERWAATVPGCFVRALTQSELRASLGL